MGLVRFRQSIVLGCGLAGIAAAAALRDCCGEVVLIERDRLWQRHVPRRGQPQANHLHNLLGRAQVELERLLPGFGASLRAAGGQEASVADQTHVFEFGHRMPERDLGLSIVTAPRPVVDQVALRLLLARGRVTVRDGVRAVGVDTSADGHVSGAVIETGSGRLERIPGDIVVDATGAGSRALKWLSGDARWCPSVDRSRPNRKYVTCLCDRPASLEGVRDFWLTFPSVPGGRSGLVSPSKVSRWFVSLSLSANDAPPRNFDEMKAVACTLEDPSIARLLERAPAGSVPHLIRRTTTTWKRYDRLDRPLLGFLPIGDAIGTLDPLFGQGISVAAWQASGLARMLREITAGSASAQLTRLTPAYLRYASNACQAAWTIRRSVEGALAGAAGESDRISAFVELIRDDPEVHRTYVRIWHLLEPAKALEDPALVSKLTFRRAG